MTVRELEQLVEAGPVSFDAIGLRLSLTILDLIGDWRVMQAEVSRLAAKDADSPTVRRCRELLANLKLKEE